MAYVKRDLFCSRRPGVEITWLDFKLTYRNRLLIAVCYQPPNSAAADRFLFRMCCSNVINDFLVMLRPPFFLLATLMIVL